MSIFFTKIVPPLSIGEIRIHFLVSFSTICYGIVVEVTSSFDMRKFVLSMPKIKLKYLCLKPIWVMKNSSVIQQKFVLYIKKRLDNIYAKCYECSILGKFIEGNWVEKSGVPTNEVNARGGIGNFLAYYYTNNRSKII